MAKVTQEVDNVLWITADLDFLSDRTRTETLDLNIVLI